ncbi:MAG: hypothetical protein LBS74_10875 [Oscillospiraceae bacterium]|jgi:hypothetical protein|nr:hypothetical protein [Oscillospiraceae bacterium]
MMSKRRRKKASALKAVPFVLAAVFVMLSAISVGYAKWSDSVQVQGTVIYRTIEPMKLHINDPDMPNLLALYNAQVGYYGFPASTAGLYAAVSGSLPTNWFAWQITETWAGYYNTIALKGQTPNYTINTNDTASVRATVTSATPAAAPNYVYNYDYFTGTGQWGIGATNPWDPITPWNGNSTKGTLYNIANNMYGAPVVTPIANIYAANNAPTFGRARIPFTVAVNNSNDEAVQLTVTSKPNNCDVSITTSLNVPANGSASFTVEPTGGAGTYVINLQDDSGNNYSVTVVVS